MPGLILKYSKYIVVCEYVSLLTKIIIQVANGRYFYP